MPVVIRRRAGQERTVQREVQLITNQLHALKIDKNERYKKRLRKDATPAEIAVRRYLRIIKVRAIFQKGFFSPFHIIADFYFPRRKIILEIDGGYHKNQVEKDRNRDEAFLRCRGIRTVRVTNDDVFSGRFKDLLEQAGINALSVTERYGR